MSQITSYSTADYRIKANPEEKVTVWLRPSDKRTRIFHCHICQNRLFKYEGTVISMIPGDVNVEKKINNKPVEVRCKGGNAKYGNCPALYIIAWTE